MYKSTKWNLFIDVLMLPMIPLLFLYNQNSKFLYLPHIIIVGLILIVTNAIYYSLCRFVYKSDYFAFLASVILVVLLFSHNIIYNVLFQYGYSSTLLLLMIPFLTYLITYGFYRKFKDAQFCKYQLYITIFILIMILLNIYPLFKKKYVNNDNYNNTKYKSDFITDNTLPSPNVYWILCDGMLGFDAMEKYFNNPQNELIGKLADRGFVINKSAMIETGHLTRIAIPTLMCPDYYDKYLDDILSNHDTAMELQESSDAKLYSARVNNETINAFNDKGYTTVAIALDDRYFLPTTDYFYYIDAYYKSHKDYYTEPNLVKKSKEDDKGFDKSRIYAHQLGEIFLGGIPGVIYDRLYNRNGMIKQPLLTCFNNTSDILLNNSNGKINYALINSLYDSLHSKEITEPKFVVVHYLIAHRPFIFDENGAIIKKEDTNNILSYPAHHTYSTKVLINLVDMIINADPDAVIILQADHGLHMQSERQIIEGLGNQGAMIDIWNNVFCSVRLPKQYQNGDESYAMADPRNISRYIINSFVGKNYTYLVD